MLIFWKERLVFLATPKTGSTSLETVLEPFAHAALRRPPELKHIPAGKYRRHLAPLLEGLAGETFTTVALMREPVDWLGSWFRFRQREDIVGRDRSTRGLTFEQAVAGYLAEPQAPNMAVGTQSRFLCGRGAKPLVDRIFRYEAMADMVAFFEDRLDCSLALPHLNGSPAAPLDLSPETDRRLRARLAPDLALYDRLA